jgi:hypothetical protein
MKSSPKLAALFPLFLAISFCACSQSPEAGQSEPSLKPREALLSAMRAKLNARSYRMKVVQSSDLMNSEIEADYVAPDRFRAVSEANAFNRASGRQEMIILGKEAYLKPPGENWQKQEVDQQRMEFTRLRDEMLIENLARAADIEVKFVGKEELQGEPMFVYQHSSGEIPDQAAGGQTRTWVGVKDGLPYKIELDAWVKPDRQVMTVKTTTTYYDYNADIVIQRPM